MCIDVVRNCPRELAAATLLCLVVGGLHAEPERTRIDGLQHSTVEESKQAYLYCNREALAGRLGHGAIMGCSTVYEVLKQKAFGGDFDQLLAWSRTQEPEPDSLSWTAARRR